MDHHHIQADLAGPARALRGEIPAVMSAFAELSRAAMADGELSTATKELIALSIAISGKNAASATRPRVRSIRII